MQQACTAVLVVLKGPVAGCVLYGISVLGDKTIMKVRNIHPVNMPQLIISRTKLPYGRSDG